MARTVDGRLAYADLLRVLATMAAIILHISVYWRDQTTAGGTAWTVLCTYDGLMRWCVPMFAMLSGAFLLDPKKSVRLRDIFFKYILRVLAVLLAWGFVYSLLVYGHTDRHFTWTGIKSAFYHVVQAQAADHFWFLYILIGLYLVTPILRAFVRGASRGTFHWFFALAFLICSVLPVLRVFCPDQAALPIVWLDKLDIHLVLGYAGYYVAGYYLKNYTLGRLAEFTAYILGIFGAVATVWGGVIWSGGSWQEAFFTFCAPNVVFMSVAVFVLFRYVLGVSDERSRRQRLSGVARITLGIYMIHGFFILLLCYLGVSTLSFHPVISVPVLAAAVFLCSFAVAWLISKIPLLGHYLT